MPNEHTLDDLRELQAMPLLAKEMLTRARIHEWQVNSTFGIETGVVSFSGGKDSTVLLHLCRKLYPNIPAVFSNTGLEYPEIQSFVKKHDNVKIVRPKMQFSEVISTYGYPLIGKEVAEAIYYARRIRPSAERERERERETQNEHHIQTSGAANRRTVLMGKMPSDTHTHTHTTGRKRTELCGKRSARDGTCGDTQSDEPG